MLRLILFLLFIAALALAVGAILATVRMVTGPAPHPMPKVDTMPDTFRRVAYAALIVLMFGVTSGWLGAS